MPGEPAAPREFPPSRPALVRAIGRWALTAIVVNSVIGSGVFGLPSQLAALAGQWSPVAVLIAGVSIFAIVLCFAEVGSRFDGPGGAYLYTREAFGPALGFQIGWLHIWTRVISCAAVLNVLSSYTAPLVPWAGTPAGRASVMIGAMTLVTAVNLAGVRQAAWTVNAFTIAKLLPLVLVIALGLVNFTPEVAARQEVVQPKWTDAILLLVFAYGGFESAVVAGSESRDPRRDTAFALITAMLTITMIYCLIQAAVIGVLPDAASSRAPIADTLAVLLGPAGLTLGSVAVVVSVYGWLTGFSLMSPRVFYSMAERGELPQILGRVHPRWRTPYVAIVVNAAIGLGLGLAGSFGQLATFSAIVRLGIYIATCAALIRLRGRGGDAFLVPGGPAVAVTGIAFCIWLLSTRSFAQAWFLPIIVAAGGAVWLTMQRRRGPPAIEA